MKKEEIPDSICVLPWIHLCTWTNGNVYPCCINHETTFGNVQNGSIENIYNSPQAKAFRQEMLGGQLPKTCSRCVQQEKVFGAESYRQAMNGQYAEAITAILSAPQDGTVEDFNFKYIDVRFSNVCNFSCRTCDAINSSGVADTEKKLGILPSSHKSLKKAFQSAEDFFPFFEKHIQSIHQIYFCGGEPLLLIEHYRILELLIKHKRFDVMLRYNTNLSNLKFGQYSAVELWKKFERVVIGASLDAGGTRAEYLRVGTRWTDIERNRQILLEEVPHAYFYLQPTLQLMNVLHWPDLHLDWINRGWSHPDQIHYNILTDPKEYSLMAFDLPYKNLVIEKWLDYLNKLQNIGLSSAKEQALLSVVNFARVEGDHRPLLNEFRKKTEVLDRLNKVDFCQTFPELAELYSSAHVT